MPKLIYIPFNNRDVKLSPGDLRELFDAIYDLSIKGQKVEVFIYTSNGPLDMLADITPLPDFIEKLEVVAKKSFDQKEADELALERVGNDGDNVLTVRLIPKGILDATQKNVLLNSLRSDWNTAYVIEIGS